MTKENLGGFEHRVLLAALRLGANAFTASVVDELEDRTGKSGAPAAVYIALQRLERRGLLESEIRVDAGSGDRRERRYFTVTDRGVALLQEAQRDLQSLWHDLEMRRAR